MKPAQVSKTAIDKNLFVPQRQAAAGILVAFAGALQQLFKISWPLFIYLILSLHKRETPDFIDGLGAGLLLLLPGLLLYAWIWYRNFQFYIDPVEQVFVLQKGIWNKKKTLIHLNRIQQVNSSQHVIQQLLDVHTLEIETAGSAEPEIRIKAVKQATVDALKTYLMEQRVENGVPKTGVSPEADVPSEADASPKADASPEAGAPSEADAPSEAAASPEAGHRPGRPGQDTGPADAVKQGPESGPVYAVPLRRLFLFGMSANYLESALILVGFFLTLYDDFNNLLSEEQIGDHFRVLAGPVSSAFSYIFLFIGLLLLVFAFNLLRSVLPYYDFRIFHKRPGFHLTYGLLKQKNLLLHLQKIKLVRLSQNRVQALWGLHRLTVQQSISPGQDERSSTIVVPACTDSEAGHLIKLFFSAQPVQGRMFRPDIRKLLSMIGMVMIPLALFLVVLLTKDLPAIYGLAIPLYLAFSGCMVYLAYRNNALYVHPDFILYRRGAWTNEVTILRPDRIQSVSLRQTLWHRKAGVGHLALHTAGGSLTFRYGRFPEMQALADYLLATIESDPAPQEV